MAERGSTRDVGDGDDGGVAAVMTPIGRRWAVLIGVSEYGNARMNLSFAHRDAQALRALLVTPEGGNFAPEHVRLLCNEEATTAAVTRAVRGFLLEAVPADLVVMFFACHGGPDPRRPSGPLYLYTHDTDVRDVAGTAFPMDEIDRSLRQLIQAERIMILADTCHSGGIGGGPGTRSAVTAEATNVYLAAMAAAKGGVALLTSAEAAEAAEEGAKYGGGHGVFTHYLLEGMRGAADGHGGGRKDGIVSIGELFEYVRDQVQRATAGRQHPAIGTTRFDRNMPVAVTGDLDVEQFLALGRRLLDVGWLLDDPAPMLLAARQFGLAAELKRDLPTADAARGEALLAAGRSAEAATALTAAVAAAPDRLDDSAWLHLGIAEGELGHSDAAVGALTEHRRRATGSDDDPWVGAYVDWLQRPSGRLRALLIGAGTFLLGAGITPLPGPANDVAILRELLIASFGGRADDIRTCVDDAADTAAIRGALADLAGRTEPDDVVVVYFCGHSFATAGADEAFLVSHDLEPEAPDGITARELVTALDITARAVVLVMDTHISPALLALLDERAHVTALLACRVGEVAYERPIGGTHHGVFTTGLIDELRASGGDVSYGALVDGVVRRMQQDPEPLAQTPQLSGDRDCRIFDGRFFHRDLWRAVRRATPREVDRAVLDRAIDAFDLPLARWARGRCALADGDAALARSHLGRAAAVAASTPAEMALDIARAELDGGDPKAAAAAIGDASGEVPGEPGRLLQRALGLLATGPTQPPALCLIAPMSGFDAERMNERVQALAESLGASFGIGADAVETLGPRRATVAAVRTSVDRYARSTDEGMVVLVYSGAVRADAKGYKYRLADGWLPAAELDAMTTGATHLVTLLDLADLDSVVHRDVRAAAPFDDSLGFDVAAVSRDPASTDRLVATLRDAMVRRATYGEWTARIDRVVVHPDSAADLPVVDRAVRTWARRLVHRARRWVADEAADLAGEAIERRRARHEEHPEGHLQRGLAFAAALRHDDALAELRAARNLYDDRSIAETERLRDPDSARWHLEARYHYGRTQYEHGDDLNDAVAALRAAVRDAPDDPRILLHLSRAITALVERESLVEARQYARHYLELGAPLGRRTELRAFVQTETAAAR